MHTTFGMTQDTAIGNCVDSIAVVIQEHLRTIQEKGQLEKQIAEFIQKYNKTSINKYNNHFIEEGFFDQIIDSDGLFIHGGRFIEILATYGDHYGPKDRIKKIVQFNNNVKPSSKNNDLNMSFAGF